MRPRLVAQIAFGEWTRDGKLRHPRYLGLREDKPANEVIREVATPGADCSARLGGGTHATSLLEHSRPSDLDPGNELHAPSAKETD